MLIDGEYKAYQLNEQLYHCGTSLTMSFIGGKWKCVVLWYLRHGPIRFSELKRLCPYITEKMLSLQLKSLKEDGLVNRHQQGDKAPFKVSYQLTEFGESVIPVIAAINRWGTELANKKGELVSLDQIPS